MTQTRSIIFKTYYWNYEETDDNKLLIHVGGKTKDDQSVHCVIEGFCPFVYIELPKLPYKLPWNKAKADAVVDYFKKVMRKEGPIDHSLHKKFKLHYKTLCNTIRVTLPTARAAHNLASRCRNSKNGLVIDGIGNFKAGEFVVHEHNLDPVLKFTALKRLKLAGWIEVRETIPEGEEEMDVEQRKFTTADIDLKASWKDVEAYNPPEIWIVRPKYLSFDIECNSKNHNSKLPDPDIHENCIFQLASTFGKFGEAPERRVKYLFSLGNPLNIKGVIVRRFKTEKELLLAWKALVDQENPDVILGFNILKFDWNYMIHRAEKLGIYTKFALLSRIIGRRAEVKKTAWSSSAYGDQEFRYLDPFGRTNVDVLTEIERNFKLPKNSLEAVSEYFLKQHKEDVTPRQLFMLFQLTMEMTPVVEALDDRAIVPRSTRIEIKKRFIEILPMRRCHGAVQKFRTKLMNAKTGAEFKKGIRRAFTITGTYNVQDTILPIDIAEKLNLWTTMEEMSNCMNVPISYLHTRGQQIKVLAQIYRETIFNGIIIPFNSKEAEFERYQGAMVIEANPGDYDNVVCYDFESLYPSVMIAFNICHTTLLRDDDPTSDELCHVLAWEDHNGCPHDPQHRKKKADMVLCKKHRYRFLKVITLPDGTRENEGLLPRLVRRLLTDRKKIKREMAKLEAKLKTTKGLAMPEDIARYKEMGWEVLVKGFLTDKQMDILKTEIAVFNARQNALKISSNSTYGSLGAQSGFVPLVPGAASVTAMGRMLIIEAIRYILEKYPGDPLNQEGKAKLVYGDSVTADTAILIEMDGMLNYINIEDLPIEGGWKKYRSGKEIAVPMKGVKVWSDQGFTPIKKIIRHYTTKNIFRVLTHTGSVDVTEDHSLLDPEGEKVRPKDLRVKDKLLHHALPVITNPSQVEMCVYAMGLFYGDGSCGYYNCPSGKKATWAINNTNKTFLNKAKHELEQFYNFEFKILDTLESSGVYKLVPKGKGIIDFVHEWRGYFYSPRRQKKVPMEILNADEETIKTFLEGYYDADGDKNGQRFDNKGSIGSAGLLYLYERLGYSTSLNCRKDKTEIYRVTLTKRKQRRDPFGVKKIWNLGVGEAFVYDLETENHHFAAGVGKMIVHNTDSAMITFVKKTTEQSFVLGDRISKEVSHHLKTYLLGFVENYELRCPSENISYRIDKYDRAKIDELEDPQKVQVHQYDSNPINLQFENLYKRFLLLTKKRYVAIAVNRKGEDIAKIKKGVVTARRDNCQYNRDSFDCVKDAVLERKSETEVMRLVYDRVHKLFTRQIPDAHLIIYTGVNSIINYALKKEKKEGRTVIERVFIDQNKEPIEDPDGPLDPRLIYPNLPQVLLALKMLRRGDDVPSNTKLEYLYVENDQASHQGEKAEDYTFYKENKATMGFRPDYLHYLEKQLCKPLMELIRTKYARRDMIPYEPLEDALERLIQGLDQLLRHRVEHIKKYERTIEGYPFLPRVYHYTKVDALVQYILDSAQRKRLNPRAANEVDGTKHAELIQVCLRLKSKAILNAMCVRAKAPKRRLKKPTQTGEKLRLKTEKRGPTEVLLTEVHRGYKRGDKAKLLGIREEEDELSSTTKKKKMSYFYSLQMSDGTILEEVPRSTFTTFRLRDDNVMDDILATRTAFKKVVKEIEHWFATPITFVST